MFGRGKGEKERIETPEQLAKRETKSLLQKVHPDLLGSFIQKIPDLERRQALMAATDNEAKIVSAVLNEITQEGFPSNASKAWAETWLGKEVSLVHLKQRDGVPTGMRTSGQPYKIATPKEFISAATHFFDTGDMPKEEPRVSTTQRPQDAATQRARDAYADTMREWATMTPEEHTAAIRKEQEERDRKMREREAEEVARTKERAESAKTREQLTTLWCKNVLNVDFNSEDTRDQEFLSKIREDIYMGNLVIEKPQFNRKWDQPKSINLFSNVTVCKSPISVVAIDSRKGRRKIYLPDLSNIDRLKKQLADIVLPTIENDMKLFDSASGVMEKWERITSVLGNGLQLPYSTHDLKSYYSIIDVVDEYLHQSGMVNQPQPKHRFRTIRFQDLYAGSKSEDRIESFMVQIGHDTWGDKQKLKDMLKVVFEK